jgi:hypothetical protein
MKINRSQPSHAPRPAFWLAIAFLALGLLLTLPAVAFPTLFGGQLYYTGGDVTVDVLYRNTVFGQVLQLWSGSTAFDIADGSKTGTSVTLTEAQLAGMGIGVGDELRFGIHVLNTKQSFLVGPGSRNADGIDHAYVRMGRSSVTVGFEDLYGGGDRDYNDTIYRITGATMSPRLVGGPSAAPSGERSRSVSEPTAVALILSGMGLLGYASYRRRRA